MNIMRTIYQFFKKFYKTLLPTRLYLLIEGRKVGVKYIIAGGTAAVVNLVALYFFTDILKIWYVTSSVFAFVISLITSFGLHKFWTFRENSVNRLKRQFIFYLFISLCNLILNAILIYVMVDIFGLWYMLAQFIIMALIALASFLINKKITFIKQNEGAKKNILLATGIYPPDIGGPATYVKILQEELPKIGYNDALMKKILDKEFIKNGYQIKIVTYGEGKSTGDIFYVSRKQNKLLRYFKYFWKIFTWLTWADIVYAQGPVSEGWPTYWACKLRGRDYFLKIVGDYAWEQGVQRFGVKEVLDDFFASKYGGYVQKMYNIEKKVANGAKKIIVPSYYLQNIVARWGVDKQKINVVYNTVHFKPALVMNKPLAERWLVSVGRLTPWKGMDMLIKIMPDLLKNYPNLKLKIIGDGPQRNHLENLIVDLQLKDSVQLLGQKSHDDVLGYVKTADLFILNSSYEGLSHVILEAFTCQTPVIATRVGGNHELIDHGVNGWLVKFNDRNDLKEAIAYLLDNDQLQKKFIDNARCRTTEFLQEKMIGQTIKILTS